MFGPWSGDVSHQQSKGSEMASNVNSSKKWTLTHCELTSQLTFIVPDVQRYVLFWTQDQQAVLGKALMEGKETDMKREGVRKRNSNKSKYIRIFILILGSLQQEGES